MADILFPHLGRSAERDRGSWVVEQKQKQEQVACAMCDIDMPSSDAVTVWNGPFEIAHLCPLCITRGEFHSTYHQNLAKLYRGVRV